MKNESTITLELLYANKRSKKHLIFEKSEHFKNSQNWPRDKAYRLCEIATLGQNLKCQKRVKNNSTTLLELLYARNCSKKHQIFEKREHFQNSQNWPRGKGYSRLSKIAIFGQNLKMPKTCEKRFYNHIRVVVCKKPLEKTSNIPKIRAFLKYPKLAERQTL